MARGAAALRQPVPHSFENWPECSTADAAAAPAGQCDGEAVPTVVEVAVLAVDVVFGGEPPVVASGAAPEEMSRTNRFLRSRSQGRAGASGSSGTAACSMTGAAGVATKPVQGMRGVHTGSGHGAATATNGTAVNRVVHAAVVDATDSTAQSGVLSFQAASDSSGMPRPAPVTFAAVWGSDGMAAASTRGSSSAAAPVASYAAAFAKPSMDELKALLQEAVTAILAESSLAMLECEARSAAAQREKLERDELLARRAAVLRRQEALRQRCMRLSSERRAAASDGASAMRAEHAVAAAGPWQNMQLWGKACAIVVDSRSLVFNLEDVDVSEDKVSRQSSGAWEQGPAALDYKRRLAEGAPRGCGAIHFEWSSGSTGGGIGVSVVEPEVSKARRMLPR